MPLKIGILGAAGIAPAAVIRPARRREDGTAVVAVASRRGTPEQYARQHGIGRAHASYEALLADDVYVALPPSAHAEWTIAALEAGKDVLCEKPFTMTAAEADLVRAAAERTGRRAIEAFHDHYHPLEAAVRELVASGRLGTVRSVSAVFDGSNPYDATSIRHAPELGGGALMDLGCYPVHWVRSLFGEPVVHHASFTANPLGVDVAFEAALELPGGITGTIASSMAEGVTLRSDLDIEGDVGRLRVTNLVFPSQGHSIRLEIDGLPRTWTVAGEETYDHQLAAVVDALADGTALPTEGRDPVDNMRVLDAVHAAAGMPWPPLG
jgi:predicted dehydrogenase